MKTRTWIILFAALAVVCVGLSLFFFCAGDASRYAEVYSDGELVLTLDLQVDGTYRVGTADLRQRGLLFLPGLRQASSLRQRRAYRLPAQPHGRQICR